MVAIELQNVATESKVPEACEFSRWAQSISTPENQPQLVALRVVDEVEMTALNETYRQKHGPTNVLSFPAELHEEVELPFIGDVVICASIVISEAKQQGKLEQSHWAHMTVHGILHLQGYDHIDEEDAKIMESLEIQIMQKLGFANPYQPL